LSDPAPPPAPTPVIPANTAYTLVYQDGMFLTSGEMTTAQNYFVNWLTLQNELLYTPGVLSGLLVSNPSGNTLNVDSGAGIDAVGHFVILPTGTGNTLTVSTKAANPSYVGIVYPAVPPPVTGMAYTVNTAGQLQLANSIDELPDNSIVLAQVNMTSNGGIDSLQDLRQPVTTRLPANLGTSSEQALAAPSPSSRSGVAAVSRSPLRKQGDSSSQVVYYNDLHTPAFSGVPKVLVTVQGSEPYATSVSEVGPAQFTLTLTAVLTPAAGASGPISVQWMAYV
jgi:hypothetical protein